MKASQSLVFGSRNSTRRQKHIQGNNSSYNCSEYNKYWGVLLARFVIAFLACNFFWLHQLASIYWYLGSFLLKHSGTKAYSVYIYTHTNTHLAKSETQILLYFIGSTHLIFLSKALSCSSIVDLMLEWTVVSEKHP